MASWPDSLPQALQIPGYSRTRNPEALRTATDAGPAKRRRRFTAASEPHSGQVTLNKAQLTTLKDFYFDSLQGGALEFDWTDPISGTTVCCPNES